MAATVLPKIDAPRSQQYQSERRGSQSARSARYDIVAEKEKWKLERQRMMDRLDQEARARHVLSKQLQMREEGVSRMQAENSRTVERLQMQIHGLRNGREELLLSIQDKDRALEEERSFRFALETRIADLLTDGLQISERLTTQDILEFTGLSRASGARTDTQVVALKQPHASKKPKPGLDGFRLVEDLPATSTSCYVPSKSGESSLPRTGQSDTDLPHFLLNSRESSGDDVFRQEVDELDPSNLISRLVTVWRHEKMESVANARAQREALDHVCSKLQEEIAKLQGELSQLKERDRDHEATVARLEHQAAAFREERDHAREEARISATQSVEKTSDKDLSKAENDDLRRVIGTLQHERDFLQSQTDQLGKNLATLKGGLAWKGQIQQVLVGLKGMFDIFKEFETKITFRLVEMGNRITKLKLRLDAQDIMMHNRNASLPQNALPQLSDKTISPRGSVTEGHGESDASNGICWKHVVLEDPRAVPLVLAELDLKHLQQKSLASLFQKVASSASTTADVGKTRELFDVQTRIEAINFAQCVLADLLNTKEAGDAYRLWANFVKKHVMHTDGSLLSGKSPLSKETFGNVVKASLAAFFEEFPGMSLASFQGSLTQEDTKNRKGKPGPIDITSTDAKEASALDEALEVEAKLQGGEAELLSFRDRRERISYGVKDSKNWTSSRSAANTKVYGYALGLPGRPGLAR